MEMKAPATTAQPQPPSGGAYPAAGPRGGGMAAHRGERRRRRPEVEECLVGHTEQAGPQRDLEGVREPRVNH